MLAMFVTYEDYAMKEQLIMWRVTPVSSVYMHISLEILGIHLKTIGAFKNSHYYNRSSPYSTSAML